MKHMARYRLQEIFKPGTHKAMDQRVLNFSESQVEAIVANYDPNLYTAPFTHGHPSDEKTVAFGWVNGLNMAADGKLLAEPKDVNPAYGEVIAKGEKNQWSSSFYEPGSDYHPLKGKPGHDQYYLRHVGLVLIPAVKGLSKANLQPAAFADAGVGVVEFSFDEVLVARIFRNIREFMIGKYGKDEADKVVNPFDLESLDAMARQPEPKETSAMAAYAEAQSQLIQRETALAYREAEIAQLQTAATAEVERIRAEALLEVQQANQRRENLSFLEGLNKNGVRFAPAFTDGLLDLMAQLPSGGTAQFAEGDTTTAVPNGEFLRRLLGSLPEQVSFKEVFPAGRAVNAEDAVTLANRIGEVMTETGLSASQALAHIQKGV